jgi:hypothetical protein
VEFDLFDLDADETAQGYEPGTFDVVVAANAVHAVRDLRAALRRLKTLLAPGGVLVLVESTSHMAYFDITTGLIEGWQHFADDLRGDNPLLPAEGWTAALLDAGMTDARAWPERGSLADGLGQHVIVAVAPGRIESSLTASTVIRTIDQPTADSAPEDIGEAVGRSRPSVRDRLSNALPSERAAILCEVVRTEVTRILRLPPASPPSLRDRLMDLGMDSLMAVQLRNALNGAVEPGRGLPATLMFDYPTIEAIADFLLAQIEPAAAIAPARDVGEPVPVCDPAPLAASAIAAMTDDQIADLLLQRKGDA